jgi:hypothetical protein
LQRVWFDLPLFDVCAVTEVKTQKRRKLRA